MSPTCAYTSLDKFIAFNKKNEPKIPGKIESKTANGKIIYGLFGGIIAVLIRVLNPAYPEGVMLAILFMNIMAPIIDH